MHGPLYTPDEYLDEVVYQLHLTREPNPEIIRWVGIGVLEDLLSDDEAALWPRIEDLARRDERFRRALAESWASGSPGFERRASFLKELDDEDADASSPFTPPVPLRYSAIIAHMRSTPGLPIPLGFFAIHDPQISVDQACAVINGTKDQLTRDPTGVAAYLRSGTVLLAFDETTEDLFGGAFTVENGRAVLSDGVFFWRRDTAEYVEQYGVTLPEAFLVHAAENAWTAPTISAEASLKAEWAIYRYYQQELDESLWPTEPGIDRST